MYKYEVVSTLLLAEFIHKCKELGKENWELINSFVFNSKIVGIFKKYIAP